MMASTVTGTLALGPQGARMKLPQELLLLLLFVRLGGQSWIKPTVAVGIEGVQFRLPMQELECPQSRRDQFCQIPPHGMPNYKCHCLGCHSAPSLSGQTSSHCLLIPEMAHFWSNPFLGDLVLMLRETQQLPSPQPCLSLLCCSRWAVLRWDKGCCSSSVPLCPRHEAGSVTRASGVKYFGIWSVPARNGAEELLQLMAKVSV